MLESGWMTVWPPDGWPLLVPVVLVAVLVGGLAVYRALKAPQILKDQQARHQQEMARLLEQREQARMLLSIESSVILCWRDADQQIEIFGDAALVSGQLLRAPEFHQWLPKDSADRLQEAIAPLRQRGTGFVLHLAGHHHRFIEATGLPMLGQAVVRLRDVTGEPLEIRRLQEESSQLRKEMVQWHETLDQLPHPIWHRNETGELVWTNRAYVEAVEARDRGDVVVHGIEFLESAMREDAADARERHEPWSARTTVIAAGEQRFFDVTERPMRFGSLGFAQDVSHLEAARADLRRQLESQLRTLDQLPTAVAVFDQSARLAFCNSAWINLWHFDQNLIQTQPTDSEILDRLFSERQLPEQADYRAWKTQWLSAYRALETTEKIWHLPDGRSLRVVINPNPKGGVTYLFDDLTEKLNLESGFKSMMRVQTETVDTLTEAVAVFGTNGRLKLFNPAFCDMWQMSPDQLAGEPHIDRVIGLVTTLYPEEAAWAQIRGLVTGFDENRKGLTLSMDRPDGMVLTCTAAPLPDGSTLFTFTDITATVSVERALKERNDALEHAGQLRDNFVHQVSYQLRSPLTNVIGFTQMLAEGHIGTLNAKQHEYASLIMHSSNAVLAIIDDILDLASIDTGDLSLELGEVDLPEVIRRAAEGLQDRIVEQKLTLSIDADPRLGSFRGDAHRLRQIVFNLLSNAIGFSQAGQTITVRAVRKGSDVELQIADQGRGIEPGMMDRVFDRFESRTSGSRHRGVGLGLSLVRSFVELHGGHVTLDSRPDHGTQVTCTFPVAGPAKAAITVQAAGERASQS
jgi:signal transduction histidine kinase